MNKDKAIEKIKDLFCSYNHAAPVSDVNRLAVLDSGKVYELYVLSVLVDDLLCRGYSVKLIGNGLKFKGGPGMVKSTDPHFEIGAPNGQHFYLFVDIEIRTMGAKCAGGAIDRSAYHEVDLVVLKDDAEGYPSFDKVALAVECKSHAAFNKGLLKEALGIRRELSMCASPGLSTLSGPFGGGVMVRADPPSEFWLASPDPDVNLYARSPGFFSLELRQLTP